MFENFPSRLKVAMDTKSISKQKLSRTSHVRSSIRLWMGKKKPKIVSRWQPLPENACTMQVLVVPEADEHRFYPEEMTNQELKNLSVFIEQSNKTLEVESMVIERYLSRTDSSSLSKMNQILEAAAIAFQKAERSEKRTASIARDAPLGRTVDDSSSSSSVSSAVRSDSSRTPKIGGFLLADKGPKVQAAQKIEIVNREIDELKNVLDNFRKKARQFNYVLRCRSEETSARLQEITDAQYNFENKLLVEGLDPITGKLPGEKFIRYLESRLKAEEMEIDKMRIKTGSLKAHLKKVKVQLAHKEELGDVIRAVDFELLKIENRECQERFDETVARLIRIKRINGKYGTLLNVNKKRLSEQMKALSDLHQFTVVKDKMIKKLMVDEEKVNSEVVAASKCLDKITRLMNSYTVPDLMGYIQKKAEVHDLKKELKVCERKIKLKDLVLSSQLQKMKSSTLGISKSSVFGSVSSQNFKDSRYSDYYYQDNYNYRDSNTSGITIVKTAAISQLQGQLRVQMQL